MITELIFDWAKQTPEKTAVIHNDRSWSYGSFAKQIAIARAYFLRRGYTGPGYAVLAIHDLMDFWIFSLALRSLGLTTVAISIAAMLDRLELLDMRCVITSPTESWPNLARQCAAHGWTLLSVSLEDEADLNSSALEAPHEPGGHILLTSGTTGDYKMVLNSPAIDAVFLRQKVNVTGMSRETVLSVFDFPAWTAAGYRWAASPWLVGGTTVIEQRREPYRALLHTGLTHAVIVPARLDPILAAPANAFARNDALQLAVGGGALTSRQIEQARARITLRLFSWLGSTEADGIAYTPLETPEDQRWHRLVADRVVEIVNDSDRPVSTGEVGRVRVGTTDGPPGYLCNDAATRTFFKNGYFYPGDLALTRSDGRIALQGRATDVINMRGRKIFPGPIEERLSEFLNVSGVCLFSMQDESGEEEIYVAIETATPIEPELLQTAINRELKAYPRARVRYVSSLPRNPMGKVLRQAVRTSIFVGSSSLS